MSEGTSGAAGTSTMRGLRWFGDGACLGQDVATGETHMVFRLLPGELAQVRCVESGARGRRRYVVDTVLEVSSERSSVECGGWYAGCAGCGLLHVRAGEERRYKLGLVAEVMERLAGVRAEQVDWVGAGATESVRAAGSDDRRLPSPARRRTRVRLVRSGGRLVLTFGGVDGSQVEVGSCGALVDELQRVVSAVRTVGPSSVPLPDEPVWFSAELDEAGGVVLHGDAPEAARWGAALARCLSEATGLLVVWTDGAPAWSTATDRESSKQRWLWDELRRLRADGHAFGYVLDGTCGSGGNDAGACGCGRPGVGDGRGYPGGACDRAAGEGERPRGTGAGPGRAAGHRAWAARTRGSPF